MLNPLLRNKQQAGLGGGGGGGGVITDQKGNFYILNFSILKPLLYWKLTLYQLCVLLTLKLVTNGFIEYRFA